MCEETELWLCCAELEWMLAKTGAVETQLEQPPRQSVNDVMMSSVRNATVNCGDSDDD